MKIDEKLHGTHRLNRRFVRAEPMALTELLFPKEMSPRKIEIVIFK